MKKTFCDICGKEIPVNLTNISRHDITRSGNILDVCDDCHKDFYRWKEERKAKNENRESE